MKKENKSFSNYSDLKVSTLIRKGILEITPGNEEVYREVHGKLESGQPVNENFLKKKFLIMKDDKNLTGYHIALSYDRFQEIPKREIDMEVLLTEGRAAVTVLEVLLVASKKLGKRNKAISDHVPWENFKSKKNIKNLPKLVKIQKMEGSFGRKIEQLDKLILNIKSFENFEQTQKREVINIDGENERTI